MRDFSATQAIGSGFRLIARDPVALLWWAGVYLLIGVLPQALGVWSVLPDFLASYQQLAREALQGGGRQADASTVLALQSRMMLLQPIILVSTLVSHAVLLGAIYRAVLQPQERRFGYVRFSRQELWLGLALAVLYVLLLMLIVALGVVVGVAAAIAALQAQQHGGGAAGAIVVVVLVCVGLVAAAWVMLRLSLALPMSFASANFLVFESWTLTRGHAVKLFGVGLAMFAIIMLLEMLALGLVTWIGVSALLQGQSLAALLDRPPADIARRMLPWAPIWMIAGALLAAPLYAILAAPWADIYRQLTSDEPAAV